MLESLNTSELSRIALVTGAIASTAYKDKYGVIPGGVIAPGLIVILSFISPLWCGTVLLLSFGIYFIYKAFLDKNSYKIRTPMYILASLSLAITNIVGMVYIQLGWLTPSLDNLCGSLIPAVISFTLTKQDLVKVAKALTACTIFTFLVVAAVYFGASLFHLEFDTLNQSSYTGNQLTLKYPLIQSYVALLIGYLIYRHADIRSGGYLISPIAASLLIHPLSGVLFLVGCWAVYWLVQLISSVTLVIGLKRYSLALIFSTIFVWAIELLFLHLDSTISPFLDSNIFVIVAIMSYVNDAILFWKKGVFSCMVVNTGIAMICLFLANLFALIVV